MTFRDAIAAFAADMLALAQHMTGDTAKPIETQKQALALLPPEYHRQRKEMEERLAEYEAALAGEPAPQDQGTGPIMTHINGEVDDGWDRGWNEHKVRQLVRMAQMPFVDKLDWLEEAHRLAPAICPFKSAAHDIRTSPAADEDR